ncbi:hypothetical protein WJX73_001288 [Symbiochloris irregularis]|uniref:Uncharacterized protein n=1 Tax=Symbiochloris irregularis TaxID=706552 RepID=A0AAW1NNG9_9CHLO
MYAYSLSEFLASPAAAPVSQDPTRAAWASPKGREKVLAMMTAVTLPGPEALDFVKLQIYNKSRDLHRICAACRLAYTAPLSGVDEATRKEQLLTGICSRTCYRVLTQGTAMDHLFGVGDATKIEADADSKEMRIEEAGGGLTTICPDGRVLRPLSNRSLN